MGTDAIDLNYNHMCAHHLPPNSDVTCARYMLSFLQRWRRFASSMWRCCKRIDRSPGRLSMSRTINKSYICRNVSSISQYFARISSRWHELPRLRVPAKTSFDNAVTCPSHIQVLVLLQREAPSSSTSEVSPHVPLRVAASTWSSVWWYHGTCIERKLSYADTTHLQQDWV